MENRAKGVSFEYPAIYDQPSWNSTCKPQWASQWYASFGGQLSYEIADADTRELATYLVQYIRYLQVTYPDFKLISQDQSTQNELDKVVLEYSTSESGLRMIITFFMIDHYAHSFHYTGDYAGCEIPEFGLTTRNIYDHAVETFGLIR